MRLLLACFVLFLAPAGGLFLAVHQVDAIESEFAGDAASQVARLDRIAALYPPNIRKMRSAPAILQLKEMSGGASVAANVCTTVDSPYQRLFERLHSRCDSWRLYRRARAAATLGVLVAVGCFVLVLMARIKVRRFVDHRAPAGHWIAIFIQKGLPLLLSAQIAAALSGYGVVLQTLTGKSWYAVGILTIPFLFLLIVERRLVLGFVEPQALGDVQPRVRKSRRKSQS
jgi:hypothetical protein